MARWRVIDGPTQQPVGAHDDFELWVATIVNVNDPGRRRFLRVEISRTVRDSDLDSLIGEVRQAVETDGRAAIERYLDQADPPETVLVGPASISPKDE